jgi:hypothetical protein
VRRPRPAPPHTDPRRLLHVPPAAPHWRLHVPPAAPSQRLHAMPPADASMHCPPPHMPAPPCATPRRCLHAPPTHPTPVSPHVTRRPALASPHAAPCPKPVPPCVAHCPLPVPPRTTRRLQAGAPDGHLATGRWIVAPENLARSSLLGSKTTQRMGADQRGAGNGHDIHHIIIGDGWSPFTL